MSADSFRRALLDSRVLADGGVPGLYHRSPAYESIIRGLEYYISKSGQSESYERYTFAPVMALTTLVGSGYLTSFPNLLGIISICRGNERGELATYLAAVEEGGDWIELLSAAGIALCPASCHSIYPMLSGVPIPESGRTFEVSAWCFRNEPSEDPARMQSFRLYEYVYVGTPNGALEHRERWLKRGIELMEGLGLPTNVAEASDPFFGRGGKLMAEGQLEKALKYEVLSPISSENPGAIGSANYHEDHFGDTFGLILEDGQRAHSSCYGFGLDRIALALLFQHGLQVDEWPEDVKRKLSVPERTLALGAN
jgi:seryl-tRNA synthetase